MFKGFWTPAKWIVQTQPSFQICFKDSNLENKRIVSKGNFIAHAVSLRSNYGFNVLFVPTALETECCILQYFQLNVNADRAFRKRS